MEGGARALNFENGQNKATNHAQDFIDSRVLLFRMQRLPAGKTINLMKIRCTFGGGRDSRESEKSEMKMKSKYLSLN